MGEEIDLGAGKLYCDGKLIGKVESGSVELNLKNEEKPAATINDQIDANGISVSCECKVDKSKILQLMGFKNSMEELRKEYEELGLDDSQILLAKSSNITPEQIKELKKALKQMVIDFNKIFEYIVAALSVSIESLSKLVEKQKQIEPKKVKPWKRKRFYQ